MTKIPPAKTKGVYVQLPSDYYLKKGLIQWPKPDTSSDRIKIS